MDEMREAFEEAALMEGLSVARIYDGYKADDTQWRWLGFKHGLMQAAPAHAQQWQPIESAPKDGTYVLCFWNGKNIDPLRWLSERAGWQPYGSARVGGLNPTHWMPLPAAPDAKDEVWKAALAHRDAQVGAVSEPLYTRDELVEMAKRLRMKADMINMGERIQWGSETAVMYEAADYIDALLATGQLKVRP